MRKQRRRMTIGGLTMTLALLIASSAGSLLAGKLDRYSGKLPAGLQDELEFLLDHPEYDYPLPILVTLNAPAQLPSQARALPLVGGFKDRNNAKQIQALLKNPNVRYVTLNARVQAFSLPSVAPPNSYLEAIGADKAQAAGYNGTGVGVAVLDSGVVERDFAGRVVRRVKFTSGVAEAVSGLEPDPYGHGSHVAGIAAGDGTSSLGQFRGVAPGAHIISVQVVDATGYGETANLINAIDWVIQNKDLYNIRVANLSLGKAPLDSYLLDPLCQAVEKMVEAGIVTVVSAGNFGKTANYPQVWKSITSPGNSPAVITVGAINTRGTADTDDDIATSFSSRGPSYPDEIFKPDLAAPGNGIPSVKSDGSWIELNHPELVLASNPNYLTLSGTSMAAGYVSGAAALMLQANPNLSPRLVKALMILTAIKLSGPHILEQGNGLVNIYKSVQLASSVDVASKTLGNSSLAPYWTRGDGKKVWSGGALASGRQLAYDNLVLSVPASGFWGSGSPWNPNAVWSSGTPWANGFFNPTSPIWAAGNQVWSDGIMWSDSRFWSDGVIWVEGVLWSEGVYWAEAIFWSDGTFATNGAFWIESVFQADADGGGQ